MSKVVKVLQFSPHDENCGVGKYQENFMDYFYKVPHQVETKFFDSSPYVTRKMNEEELTETLERLKNELSNYDILHIQHEFGLFSGMEFSRIIDTAKSIGKKVVVTVHLSPALAFKWKRREGVGPRSVVLVLRQRRLHGIFVSRHIEPFRKADLLITHNNGATKSLLEYGVPKSKILQFNHPVLDIVTPKQQTTEIVDNLSKKPTDIIFATVGFMHKYKGIEDAVRALKYLPETYKLAIIGGMQPISDEKNIYNNIATLIDTLDLKDRVYITGFVEDDDRLNALIREVDVCVYPYNNTYYGQVSSGALNLAFANERPVIAYPTDGFKESNVEFNHMVLCQTPAYYELAREVMRLDSRVKLDAAAQYARKYSWSNTAQLVVDSYASLLD